MELLILLCIRWRFEWDRAFWSGYLCALYIFGVVDKAAWTSRPPRPELEARSIEPTEPSDAWRNSLPSPGTTPYTEPFRLRPPLPVSPETTTNLSPSYRFLRPHFQTPSNQPSIFGNFSVWFQRNYPRFSISIELELVSSTELQNPNVYQKAKTE